ISQLVLYIDEYVNRITISSANKEPYDLRFHSLFFKKHYVILTTKANEGKSYNTIAAYRSVINKVYEYINNLLVGRNQDIAKLILDIFKSNPSVEAEDDVYDITLSLDYIVLFGNNL
ncbi:5111_t:CDS:2, partial [Cetraspora pellucida]